MIVINKSDLQRKMDISALNGARRVSVSAKTGSGLDNLHQEIRAFLMSHKTETSEDWMLTSERQYDAISQAETALGAACEGLESQVPHEMILMDLYRALEFLGELTGEVVTEDILDKIFSTFCIGK
jgi:tRNA modification GTPase